MANLSVRIAKPFDGIRHDRLYAIWEAVAEFWKDHLTVGFSRNVGARWSHAQMFNKMWAEELQTDADFVLLTEHDFLPNLNEPRWYAQPGAVLASLDAEHGEQFAGLACEYHTRCPKGMHLQGKNIPGGWWVLLETARFNDLIDFHGRPDPCNQLEEAVGGIYLCEGRDAFPRHYGIVYPFGEHLFWSRHIHDAPDRTVSGFNLGDIQLRHDKAVLAFLATAPEEFLNILRRNHAHLF